MASSGNFPLWSPLIKGSSNLTHGNTRFDGTTSSRGAMTSFAVPTGTKFYVECLVKHATNYNIVFGIANPEFNVGTYDESDASMNGILFRANNSSSWDTCSLTNGSRGSFGSNVGTTSARVLAMTVNRVDNEIKMYLDNSLKHTISISATEVYHIVCSFTGGSNSNVHMNINCGHDSTGAGDFSAGSATDENGFGEFQNTPATGFLAPSSANLPISADIDPAGDDGADENPTKQFGILTYTGNSTTGQSLTGLGFKPDLIWAKMRSSSQNNQLFDSSRLNNRGTPTPFMLRSDTTEAEIDDQAQGNNNPMIASFDTDGFTLGTSGSGPNDNARTYVAWCWRANGGTTTSDSSGDITVTRQTNDAAKFSILTYTGNGSSGSTIAHGLGVKPAMTIIKQRNSSNGWNVWHQGYNNGDYDSFGELNSNSSWYANQGSNGPYTTDPTTSLLTLTAYGQVNGSSNTYVAYVWADVEGFQKFGSYVGNGNADGAFIYTGFRPRMIFLKRTDSSGSWHVFDTARNTFNPVDTYLLWDTDGTDDTASSNSIDFLSNGFKIRNNAAGLNTSGGDYIYGAWGDVPFKYNNTF